MILLLVFCCVFGIAQTAIAQTTPVCSYTVVNSYPHDPDAFTQGLLYKDGFLYESTGLIGSSSLRRVVLESGVVVLQHDLAGTYFGEGLTFFDDRFVQLTWLTGVGFEYEPTNFAEIGSFTYEIQGWGLTDDGRNLIVSDGTSYLHFWDPLTYEQTRQVQVFDDQGPITMINELEYVYGEIFANIWQSDRIARIDAETGEVIEYIDLSDLLYPRPNEVDVLNGIAFDFDSGRLFVTGKLWPTLFEIELAGCQALPVFADGFESGSTDNWSDVSD